MTRSPRRRYQLEFAFGRCIAARSGAVLGNRCRSELQTEKPACACSRAPDPIQAQLNRRSGLLQLRKNVCSSALSGLRSSSGDSTSRASRAVGSIGCGGSQRKWCNHTPAH